MGLGDKVSAFFIKKNAAPKAPDKTASGKDVDDLIRMLDRWFLDSEKNLRAIRNQWRRNEQLYYNNLFRHPINGLNTLTQLKVNIILSTIQTMLPVMSSALPHGDIVPEELDDMEFSEPISKRVTQIEKNGLLRNAFDDAIFDSVLYGNAVPTAMPQFASVPIDTDENGLIQGEEAFVDKDGSIKIAGTDIEIPEDAVAIKFDPKKLFTKNKRTRQVFMGYKFGTLDIFSWFPSSDSINTDIFNGSRYQIIVEPVLVEDLKAELIAAGKKDLADEITGDGNIDEYRSFRFIEPNQHRSSKPGEWVLIKRAYWNDTQTRDSSGNLEFPNGRVVKWASGVKLSDEPLWTKDFLDPTRHKPGVPFYHVKNNVPAKRLSGIGEPEILETIAKTLNEVLSSTADNVKFAGNPGYFATDEWFQNVDEPPQGLPNEIIRTGQTLGSIEQRTGTPLPSTTFAFVELLLALSPLVTGVVDPVRGEPQTSTQSGRAIEKLKQSAESRLGFKTVKNFTPVVLAITKDIIWGIQRWDKQFRQIRTTDGSFVEFNPLAAPAQEGARTLESARMEIQIEPGIPFPPGTAQYEEYLLALREAGIIDTEQYILRSSIKDKESAIRTAQQNDQLSGLKADLEAQENAFPEFSALIKQALEFAKPDIQGNRPRFEQFKDSLVEENLADMLKEFPDFFATNEFRSLPVAYAQRLTQVLLEDQTELTGEGEATTGGNGQTQAPVTATVEAAGD
jgi:hypothetical protein